MDVELMHNTWPDARIEVFRRIRVVEPVMVRYPRHLSSPA